MNSYHRTAQNQLVTSGLAVLLAGVASITSAQPTTISIQATQPGKAISPVPGEQLIPTTNHQSTHHNQHYDPTTP